MTTMPSAMAGAQVRDQACLHMAEPLAGGIDQCRGSFTLGIDDLNVDHAPRKRAVCFAGWTIQRS